jgi:hypothetical protein
MTVLEVKRVSWVLRRDDGGKEVWTQELASRMLQKAQEEGRVAWCSAEEEKGQRAHAVESDIARTLHACQIKHAMRAPAGTPYTQGEVAEEGEEEDVKPDISSDLQQTLLAHGFRGNLVKGLKDHSYT